MNNGPTPFDYNREHAPAPEPPPAPLRYEPFPTLHLPDPIGGFLSDVAASIGCDAAYAAVPALAVLAAAIGTTRRIKLKDGYSEPCIIWSAVVAPPSTAKTPAFRAVVAPLENFQCEAMRDHAEAMKDHEAERLTYEKELGAWRKNGDGEPPQEPVKPTPARVLVKDSTIEALAPVLGENPRGVLVAANEMAGWVRGFGQYKSGRGGDAQHWLDLWDCLPVMKDRKGDDGPLYISLPSVCVTGGLQPGLFARCFEGEHRESGMLARLLIARPPTPPTKWRDATVPREAAAQYEALIRGLLRLEHGVDQHGDPAPVEIELTDGALRLLREWWNGPHAERMDNAATDDLRAAEGKIGAYVARLSLIICIARQVAAGEVGRGPVNEGDVRDGIGIADWFAHEAIRQYAIEHESKADAERRSLIERMERQRGTITVRDLMRGPRRYQGDHKAAEAALDDLARAGIADWDYPPPGDKGGAPARVLRLRGVNDD